VRRQLNQQLDAMRAAVLRYFPTGTKITRPDGGLFVWIELPPTVNADQLYHKAVQSGILFAPGSLFSIQGRYQHHLRLSTGTWNAGVEQAIASLGRLCARVDAKGY
jgi:DNA-binding transcriptional MocR family regulator